MDIIKHKENCLIVSDVSHFYGKTKALKQINIQIPQGCTVGLVGPDGVGKSTLLSLIAGAKILQQGSIHVLNHDISKKKNREELSHHLAFMPQGLGKNLYKTLSVYENIDFFAKLFHLNKSERHQKIMHLLYATGLAPFIDRPAGNLSGGMKQKLSLCCALIHQPDLLILDEPTTGVDPLARRQFWELTQSMRDFSPNMTMIVATAYTEEAGQFDYLMAMDSGELLIFNETQQVLNITQSQTIEEAYIKLLPEDKKASTIIEIPPLGQDVNLPYVIEANQLTKKFGSFTAVDHVSFNIRKGEIFGFLGSNGCGKSTTMKMLTGLIPATHGNAKLLGEEISHSTTDTRMKVGYMSQSFSLYEELSVRKNLILHTRLYHIDDSKIKSYIQQSLQDFNLQEWADFLPSQLSLGIRQRLQLAVACLHQPEILILDEPTSGVDPAARDLFWKHLVLLSRQKKITIFVSTHFMNEASLCDRISFMHKGKVLAIGTPQDLINHFGTKTLEDAFIHYLEIEAKKEQNQGNICEQNQLLTQKDRSNNIEQKQLLPQSLLTIGAFAYRESIEVFRDKIRMIFAFIGPVFILLIASICISFDLENIPFSVLDQDQSKESRQLIEYFAGSRYFNQLPPINSTEEISKVMKSSKARMLIEIPSGYGKDLINQRKPEIAFYLDGGIPFSALNISGFIQGIMLKYNEARILDLYQIKHNIPDVTAPRYIYNQDFKSIYSVTPGILMMIMMMIPAMLTTLSIAREKEMGSIINLYISPAKVIEFLLGKQLPYIALSMASGAILLLAATLILGVPIKGSLIGLIIGLLFYTASTTAIGLLVSCFIRSQLAALFITAIIGLLLSINFAGMIYPISTMSGSAYWLASFTPGSWFQLISIGAFTKSLPFQEFVPIYGVLLLFYLIYILLAVFFLKKQEK